MFARCTGLSLSFSLSLAAEAAFGLINPARIVPSRANSTSSAKSRVHGCHVFHAGF